ncbi:MAG: CerR family C-terminal domain-containing protein [Planctomycetota bacterium]|nr:CerR family C-terminal domain-containing protein [Planctomycetota bacterium]
MKGCTHGHQSPPTTSYDTRQRILDAATEIFAKEGYGKATVRDICQRANANVAAVNYHFGDKEKLYSEVLMQTYQAMLNRHPTSGGVPEGASPEERLAGFIRAFCRRIYGGGPESYLSWMMAREMAEPSPALDDVVQKMVRPQQQQLIAILNALLGPGLPEQALRFAMGSVLGQILFFHYCRPVVERLFPERKGLLPDPDQLADAIAAVSIPGLKALRAKYERAQEGR